VRELENRIRRAVVISTSDRLSPSDLGLTVRAAGPGVSPAVGELAVENEERNTIERLLAESDGVVSKAAAKVGISRQAMYRRMQRAGLHIERSFKGSA
jgi:DNA-binding NtrC family response regulator